MKLQTTPTELQLLKSRDTVYLICENCNNTFSTNKHSYYAALNPKTDTKLDFCSFKCRNLNNGTRILSECKQCGVKIERSKKHVLNTENLFCSHSCSAKYSNAKRRTFSDCLNCGKQIPKQRKFCSTKCCFDGKRKIYIERWLLGLEDGVVGKGNSTCKVIKDYLISVRGNKCELCGWKKINVVTGKVPIQLEHEDGNCENNNIKNLKLLCPNCHSLTPTFGALNKGKGRKHRYNKNVG